ncbi:hypothetical protein [Brevundimonas faecalis]|uniref:Type IV secretory pathway TrbL component n=1 Tax=Brevundimonas faecalis TaxID=947378 RepID=A0ABV2RD29_9CAUL
MTEQIDKTSAVEALKRALAAKKAGTQSGPAGAKGGARGAEKVMQRQAMAMNKPAFRKASKRG